MLCFLFSIASNSGLTTKNLTPEQRQQIINECVEEMISPTDLARKWNCNADTIRTWVRKAGLTLPKQYKKSIYPDSGSAPARAMGYDQPPPVSSPSVGNQIPNSSNMLIHCDHIWMLFIFLLVSVAEAAMMA